MAPALFTRISMCGKSLASWSIFLLSDRSAATVSTRTFDFCAIADFVAARVSALRDTMTTLQPSAANTSAVARPMPFDPPVIKAVLPASFKSMMSPGERGREADYEAPTGVQQPCCGLICCPLRSCGECLHDDRLARENQNRGPPLRRPPGRVPPPVLTCRFR